MTTWLRLAADPSVVRRAFLTCLLVGSLLVAINHGPAIVRGDVDAWRALQIGLTFVVPFLVSTSSSVAATRAHVTTKVGDVGAGPISR